MIALVEKTKASTMYAGGSKGVLVYCETVSCHRIGSLKLTNLKGICTLKLSASATKCKDRAQNDDVEPSMLFV